MLGGGGYALVDIYSNTFLFLHISLIYFLAFPSVLESLKERIVPLYREVVS